jgi:uncharacterized membrane protein YhaH (DUF805 family)
MSDVTQHQINPQDLLRRIPSPAMRLSALTLAVLCMFLPMASVMSFGISTSLALTHAHGMGASAWLLVLVFIAAVIVPTLDATRPFSKLLDWAAALICVCVVFWLGNEYWKGHQEIAQAHNFASTMSGMRGGVPQMVGISPGIGIIALLGLAITSVFSAWRGKV